MHNYGMVLLALLQMPSSLRETVAKKHMVIMYLCIDMYICIQYMYICIQTHTHTLTHTHTYTYTYTYTYTCTYTYTYTHTYIYTFISSIQPTAAPIR
jgi:hypothetical protein